jgi:hypothetical protein
MGPNNLADEIERVIIAVTDAYGLEIESLQNTFYNRLVTILKDLEIDSEGYIKQSAANRTILNQAESAIDELLPGTSYTDTVSRTLESINTVNSLNANYFGEVSESFNENRNFIKSLQTRTIESIETNLLGDGLKAQIKNPLAEILSNNINSGGQFSGFLEQVRSFIKGTPDLDGRLISYSRGYLRDTLFQYSRSYQEAMTADLKLDFYSYSGGLMDNSRQFCIERSGNYYHRKEIESWASENWKGKYRGTTSSSIFTYCGGYSCTHSLIPVHKSIVPKEDIQRAIEAGYIK